MDIPTMTIKLDATMFYTWLYRISKVTEETVLHFTPEGIKVIDMSGSHIFLINTFLSSKDCIDYLIETPIDFNFDLDHNLKSLKLAIKKGDQLSLTIAPGSKRRLQCEITNPKSNYKKILKITEIDIDKDSLRMDSLNAIEFKNYWQESIQVIRNIISMLYPISEEIVFEGNMNKRSYYNRDKSDKDKEDQYIELSFDENTPTIVSKYHQIYSINYLQDFLKGFNPKKEYFLTLRIQDTDSPVKIEYQENNSYSQWFLAPRVED